MPPKVEKEHLNVVDIASSDDDGDAQTVARKKASSLGERQLRRNISSPEIPQSSGSITPPALPSDETLDSRSFWKAGNYVFGPLPNQLCLKVHWSMRVYTPSFFIQMRRRISGRLEQLQS